jgi:hypothetical protein
MEVVMASVVVGCTKCGHRELGHRWDSIDQAIREGALRSTWVCPDCAWPEPDLIEIEDQAESAKEELAPAGIRTRR